MKLSMKYYTSVHRWMCPINLKMESTRTFIIPGAKKNNVMFMVVSSQALSTKKETLSIRATNCKMITNQSWSLGQQWTNKPPRVLINSIRIKVKVFQSILALSRQKMTEKSWMIGFMNDFSWLNKKDYCGFNGLVRKVIYLNFKKFIKYNHPF